MITQSQPNGVVVKIEQGLNAIKEGIGKKLADGTLDGVVDGIEAIAIGAGAKFLLGKIPGVSLVSGPAAEWVTTHVQEVTNSAMGALGVKLEGAGAPPPAVVPPAGAAAAAGSVADLVRAELAKLGIKLP